MQERTYLLVFLAAADLTKPHAVDYMQILFTLRRAATLSGSSIFSYSIVPPQLFLLVGARSSTQLNTFYQHLKTNEKWAISHQSSIDRLRSFFQVAREIEALPSREGLAHRPEDYRWSSAANHCGLRLDLTTRQHRLWAAGRGRKWARILNSQLRKEHWEVVDSLALV